MVSQWWRLSVFFTNQDTGYAAMLFCNQRMTKPCTHNVKPARGRSHSWPHPTKARKQSWSSDCLTQRHLPLLARPTWFYARIKLSGEPRKTRFWRIFFSLAWLSRKRVHKCQRGISAVKCAQVVLSGRIVLISGKILMACPLYSFWLFRVRRASFPVGVPIIIGQTVWLRTSAFLECVDLEVFRGPRWKCRRVYSGVS